MGPFGEAVDHYHDEIDRDDLPVMIWHSIGHQSSCQRGGAGLHVVTQVAALHTLHYIAAHAWPPEAACYQVCCLLLARVTHYWGVMEGGHYVVSELTIQGDIDSTSIEYQAILFPPFLMT